MDTLKEGRIISYNDDNINVMRTLSSNSIDIICIDPPYLYLKNQVLDIPFNEDIFFQECYRILKEDGFIIMFGRGISFYRWNCILNSIGFVFKEEIVRDKKNNSSPLSKISRVHETISIHTKGKGIINRVFIPYTKKRGDEIDIGGILGIRRDVSRLMNVLRNEKSLSLVLDYLDNNKDLSRKIKRNDLVESDTFTKYGVNKSKKGKATNRVVNIMQSMKLGMKESTIIREIGDHHHAIHPTQKPVILLERLLSLCIPNKIKEDIVVADFFAGSFSCMEAVYNMGMNGIAVEINKDFYDLGYKRIIDIPDKLLYSGE